MEDRLLQGNAFARSRAVVESGGKAKLSSTSGQAAKEVVDLYSSSDADEDEVQVTMVLKKSPPARKRKRVDNHVTSGGSNATPISVNPVISIDDSDEEESKNYTPPRRNQKPARSHSRPSPRSVKRHQNSSQSSPSRRSDGVLAQKEVIELDLSDDETENNKSSYSSSSSPSAPRQASETSSLSHITKQKQRNASPSLPRQHSRIASSSQSTQQSQRKTNSSLSSPVQQQASQAPRPSQSTQQRVTHYDLASSDEELNRDANCDVEKKASKPAAPPSPLKLMRKSSTQQKIVQANPGVNNSNNEISALGISSNPAWTKNMSSSNLNPGADVAISSARSKMVGKKRIENPESKKQHPRPKMTGMDDSSSSDDIPQAAFADGGRKLAVRKRIEPTKDGGKNRDKHFITKDGNPPAIIQPLPEDSATAQPTATTAAAKGRTPPPPVKELCAPPFKNSAIPPPVPALNARPVPNPLLLSVEQQKDSNDKSNCTPASRGQQCGSAASAEAGSNAFPPSKKEDTRPVPNPFLSSMEEHQDSLRSSNFTPDSKVQQSFPFKACNARNGPTVERPKPPPSLSQSLDTLPIPNPFLLSGEQRQESLLKFSCKAASTVQQPSLQKEDNDPNGSYLAPTGATSKEAKSPPTLHSLGIPPVPDPFLRPIEKHQESRHRSNSLLASSGISQSLPKTCPTRFNSRNGSHLAPVFATALARGKGLDVRTVIPPTDILTKGDHPPDIIRTKKERLLMGIHLETSNEEFKQSPPEEDELCFTIKSARQPSHQPTNNRKRSQEVKILTHQLITDEESSDATVEEAISDGVDPKIPRSFFKKPLSDLGLMPKIDFLSSTKKNQTTGLPVSTFSVHGVGFLGDDVIYDFKVEIRKSTIPNSGNGAFLTFIGARELKSSIKKRNKKTWDKRKGMTLQKSLGVDSKADPEPLLIARFNDDRCAKLTLKGNHLYSAYNSCYLDPDSIDPETRKPKSNFDEFYTAEEISGLRDPCNRIGFMQVNKESDYIPAPNRTFSSLHKSCGLIDLGKYGPYHKEDRKTDDTYNVKCFIFSHEPKEWGFGVPEEICEEEQMIDITDDLTGKPSSLAQSNIPMWVNEIGHDKRLKQTVHSLNLDDRTVEYYLRINEPLKKGDSIELLVDYYDVYEEVRNRKGYGLANLEGTVKSDEDEATRLLRNFSERDEINNIVSDIELMKMHAMLDYCISVYENLERIIRFFVDETLEANSLPSDCPSAIQVVALRRLHWLGGIFKKRVDEILSEDEKLLIPRHREEASAEPERLRLRRMAEKQARLGVLEQCAHVVSRLQSFSFSTLFDAISRVPSLDDSDGINIKKFFEAEMVEEICYGVKDVVKAPLDSSVWCGVASDLTRRLCLATASILWRDDIESSQKATQLLHSYNDETARAARLIRCRSNLDELTFHAPFHRNSGIDSTDIVWESDLSSFAPGTNVLVHKLDVTPSSADNMVDLRGIANKVDSTEIHGIQDDWYLCWQVILIVNAFGSSPTFLTGSSYSLSDLCKITGVQENHALHVTEKGINIIEKGAIEQPRRKKRKSSTPGAAPAAAEWEGKPDEPLPGGWPEGWVKKVFVRRSGATAGSRDRYWYSPINGFKLRSMKEVKKFMKAFSLYGDEILAHKNFTSMQL